MDLAISQKDYAALVRRVESAEMQVELLLDWQQDMEGICQERDELQRLVNSAYAFNLLLLRELNIQCHRTFSTEYHGWCWVLYEEKQQKFWGMNEQWVPEELYAEQFTTALEAYRYYQEHKLVMITL